MNWNIDNISLYIPKKLICLRSHSACCIVEPWHGVFRSLIVSSCEELVHQCIVPKLMNLFTNSQYHLTIIFQKNGKNWDQILGNGGGFTSHTSWFFQCYMKMRIGDWGGLTSSYGVSVINRHSHKLYWWEAYGGTEYLLKHWNSLSLSLAKDSTQTCYSFNAACFYCQLQIFGYDIWDMQVKCKNVKMIRFIRNSFSCF